jgi:hypothetical protein
VDIQHPQPPNLAARLRGAKVDERVAALLTAAIADDLGVGLLRDQDAAAAQRLTALLAVAARQTAISAVNRFALEVLALLDEAPDLREQLAQLAWRRPD